MNGFIKHNMNGFVKHFIFYLFIIGNFSILNKGITSNR